MSQKVDKYVYLAARASALIDGLVIALDCLSESELEHIKSRSAFLTDRLDDLRKFSAEYKEVSAGPAQIEYDYGKGRVKP